MLTKTFILLCKSNISKNIETLVSYDGCSPFPCDTASLSCLLQALSYMTSLSGLRLVIKTHDRERPIQLPFVFFFFHHAGKNLNIELIQAQLMVEFSSIEMNSPSQFLYTNETDLHFAVLRRHITLCVVDTFWRKTTESRDSHGALFTFTRLLDLNIEKRSCETYLVEFTHMDSLLLAL
eukprot:snap_masked-scaffold_40-processed-gene-0.22-mRNA-1 protein AED:1.00 eAED:1.00 QI:0/0/0/0/1/1/2/0/178